MPSLILEKSLSGKALKQRKTQAHEQWFSNLMAFYSINKNDYLYNEIIFRQLIMHEKFNTPFVYKNERPIQFPIKGTINEIIDQYLETDEAKDSYGILPLTFQKMDDIRWAGKAVKKRYTDIDKLKSYFSRLQKNGSDISPDYVLTHLDKLKIQTNKKIEGLILKSDKPYLKKFFKISDNGEFEIHHKSYDFFKVYSLLMYCLMERYIFDSDKKGRKATNGIYGYIAAKLNFEFGKELGFTATAKDVADKIRDNKNQIKIYKSKLKSLGLS